MNSLLDSALKYTISRRKFIGFTALATAGVALAGEQLVPISPQVAEAAGEEGKWVTAACWHNCGGRCLNKALVKDGMVIRQKTDDTHADSPDYPQQRACARGRSQRQQVLGADRLKYPMKRKNWEPGGGKKELRGRDEWVRISWDEALDIVASEIKRIKEKHGNESIMAFGSEIGRTLSLYGGYVSVWGSTSYGTWLETGPRIGLSSGNNVNDRMDMRRTQLLVLWGANPAWSSAGLPAYNYLQVKKAGARVITIDPFFSETGRLLADEWIPIRPATDHTLALALAHTLLSEDDPKTNPLIDWDFLNRCTVGFDQEHLPKGADPKENFKDYLLGTYDGQPKNAEWASEICGVSADRIRQLAREIGANQKVSLLVSWAPARVNNADSWPQAIMALGAMTGHMGLPGHMTGCCTHSGASNNGPSLVRAGSSGLPSIANPVKVRLNHNEHWRAVLEGKYMAGKGPGVTDPVNIQLIYHGGSSALNQKPGINKGIEAHRKVEFVVSHHYALNTSSKYADVVLPITTQWEREGTLLTGNREMMIYAQHVIEPLFEAKSDMWIAVELAKRLGLDAAKISPISEKQQLFNQLAGATYIKDDGKTSDKLLTITDADIKA
ncbi:MAG TPA: molybdopterin-dependent oxidoreductase, partial [Symbiobacteriaceae bacterium]|nr:molybdopterin-dependent oxidoreductase [Symbiobacteriaceae bacterium]